LEYQELNNCSGQSFQLYVQASWHTNELKAPAACTADQFTSQLCTATHVGHCVPRSHPLAAAVEQSLMTQHSPQQLHPGDPAAQLQTRVSKGVRSCRPRALSTSPVVRAKQRTARIIVGAAGRFPATPPYHSARRSTGSLAVQGEAQPIAIWPGALRCRTSTVQGQPGQHRSSTPTQCVCVVSAAPIPSPHGPDRNAQARLQRAPRAAPRLRPGCGCRRARRARVPALTCTAQTWPCRRSLPPHCACASRPPSWRLPTLSRRRRAPWLRGAGTASGAPLQNLALDEALRPT